MTRRIGTLAEKSLHAGLKDYFAQPGDRLETDLDGYVIDILRPLEDSAVPYRCIEIQTRTLAPLKPKLTALLDRYPVHVIHPIPKERFIIRIDADGVIQSRRKSPKKGTPYDVFAKLVSIPRLLLHPHFSLELLMIRDEQVWVDDQQGSWRRKKWSIHDTRLLDIMHTVTLTTAADYAALLPLTLPSAFDTHELAKAIRQPRATAQKMAYCLREMGILAIEGKRRSALLYQRVIPTIP